MTDDCASLWRFLCRPAAPSRGRRGQPGRCAVFLPPALGAWSRWCGGSRSAWLSVPPPAPPGGAPTPPLPAARRGSGVSAAVEWGGPAVARAVDVRHRGSGECLRSLVLGPLYVLADCAQCHIVFLGDLRVGQPAVEVVGHQLLNASPPEPHQEAALLEVRPWLGWPASSHRRLQRASSCHQRVTVSGVGLQDLRSSTVMPMKTNTDLSKPHQSVVSQMSLAAFFASVPGGHRVQPDESPTRDPVPHRSGSAANHLSNDVYVNTARGIGKGFDLQPCQNE